MGLLLEKKPIKKKVENFKKKVKELEKLNKKIPNKKIQEKITKQLNELGKRVKDLEVPKSKFKGKQGLEKEITSINKELINVDNKLGKNIRKKPNNLLQRIRKSTAELATKLSLITKIKEANEKVIAFGGESQLPTDLHSQSVGSLRSTREETRHEKYDLNAEIAEIKKNPNSKKDSFLKFSKIGIASIVPVGFDKQQLGGGKLNNGKKITNENNLNSLSRGITLKRA